VNTRDRWVWGVLPAELMQLGERAGRAQEQRAADRQLQGYNWTLEHSVPSLENTIRGMQAELAHRVFTGRPVPTVAELISTWNGPDVDGLAVKHTARLKRSTWGMFLTDRHLATRGVQAYVLMLTGEAPRFAIVGTIPATRVIQAACPCRTPGQILVPWVALDPYDGPRDRSYLE